MINNNNSAMNQAMAEGLQQAVNQENQGDISRDTYDQVVSCFYSMRDCWEQACGDMEMAALEIRQQLQADADQLVLATSAIITQAEQQVTGITVESSAASMLPYDYKGLAKLVQFFNLVTRGLLARRYHFAAA